MTWHPAGGYRRPAPQPGAGRWNRREMKTWVHSSAALLFAITLGCDAPSKLPKSERDVLRNYHASPAMVERAARICLARKLTKPEVLQYASDTMHRADGDSSITFLFAPSQWWTLTFDAQGKALTADITGKMMDRQGRTWSAREEAPTSRMDGAR